MKALRSLHFVPGGNERMLAKAIASNADALVLDLEDAVTPERKDDVREVVARWLEEVDFRGKETVVRVNPLQTAWGEADLTATMNAPPSAYMIPKPEAVEGLRTIDAALSALERQHGHPAGAVGLILIIETPLGVHNAPALASCPRVAALTWGAEDLAASLGAASNRSPAGGYSSPFEFARTQTLLSAAAAGVQAIDTVTVNFRDADGLRRDCKEAAAFGFTGKLSIHPTQIDVINAVFSPAPEQVAEARALVDAFAQAQADGRMAFTFNGQMVDAPHLARAKALLARAEARVEGQVETRAEERRGHGA